jgi:DnaJ-class molecular chaperone
MKECSKCEGLGILECSECTEESYDFVMSGECQACGGDLLIRCPECEGKGRVPDEEEG